MSTVIYFLLVFVVKFGFLNCDTDEIESQCTEYCENKIGNNSEVNDFFCNQDCKLKQCKWGCEHFELALSSTCQTACDEGWTSKDDSNNKVRSLQQTESQYCNKGCREAMDMYARQIKGSLRLPAPELKKGQKSHSSVILHWNMERLANVSYYVQASMVEVHSSWQIYDAIWMDSGDINVTSLRPFVTYKFKILAVITSSVFVSSNATEPITTKPFGVPSEAPKIVDVSSPTPAVITVTWDPPMYTNGQLLGYYLTLDQSDHIKQSIKEVPPNTTTWTFRQLQPAQSYIVSVCATNSEGQGPADSANITTPNPGNLSTEEMPYLILAEDNKVLKQNIKALIQSTPDQLLTTKPPSTLVQGVGIHVQKELVYVSDASKRVHVVHVRTKDVQPVFPDITDPTAISVDWLRDLVYIVNRRVIFQCDIDANSCVPATKELTDTPDDIKVDPINGYLYFTQGSDEGGLYRVDTGEIKATAASYARVINSPNIMTFALDFNNILIYFPDEMKNSMKSTSLDGSIILDIRERKSIVRPKFQNVISMVYYDQLFYWTNGSQVLMEDYDVRQDKYYHNALLFFGHHFAALNVFQQSVQPKPVPHSAPSHVQALFSAGDVNIKWEAPKRLSYQGTGAWANWSYDVLLLNNDGTQKKYLHSIKEKTVTMGDLEADTPYQVKVRAKSDTGIGPWSTVFKGRTLTRDASRATITVAFEENRRLTLEEFDLYGQFQKKLPRRIMRGALLDITWTEKMIVMVTDSNNIMTYNKTSSRFLFHFDKTAVSVAYDWLAKKIYMSIPQTPGVIKRYNIQDFSDEELVTEGLARHMTIDSVHGRLYFVTVNSVESCLLNGENNIKHFSLPLFSGKHVISLTLNFDLGKVLWYVKGYDQQVLYMTDLIRSPNVDTAPAVSLIGSVESISETSLLQYYSHRIFWQNADQQVIVGDLDVNHTSVITPQAASVFFVQHPSLHPYPDGVNASSLKIIPSKVRQSSIQCDGTWSKFNLTWEKAEVNHGQVFYELSVQSENAPIQNQIVKTERTWFTIENMKPYTPLRITVTGYTYWGYGVTTTTEILSPMSVPSMPLTPRVFVTQNKVSTTAGNCKGALFRWSAPKIFNGVIVRYIVAHWHSGKNASLIKRTLPPTSRHFSMTCLQPSLSYYFQVEACTDVGCGEQSEVVSATADAINPVPQILIATSTSIIVADMDNTQNASHTMVANTLPKTVTYLQVSQDDRLFWIDHSNVLWQLLANKTRGKLLELKSQVTDMTIDWVSRTLYILSLDESSKITAYKLDQKLQQDVMTRSSTISSLVTDPYSSAIYWTEKKLSDQHHTLYKRTGNLEPLPVFTPHERRDLNCNCSTFFNHNTGSVVALDHTNDKQMELLFYDFVSNSVVGTDKEGCVCRNIISQAEGFPPDLLSVDHLLIYWYNKKDGKLHTMEKSSGRISEITVADVKSMQAYGSHLQALPSDSCLNPEAYDGNITLLSRTNTSLTVRLDNLTWPEECKRISRPDIKYSLYYKPAMGNNKCNLDRTDCLNEEFYGNDITITGLDPYRKFSLQGAVSNYYTEYLSEALGEPYIFETKIGVPSPPSGVSVTVLTPVNLTVSWQPPLKSNGPEKDLKYSIKYSVKLENGNYQNNVVKAELKSNKLEYTLEGLNAGTVYKIQVLATNAAGKLFSESSAVEAKTFQNSGPITLVGSTHDSLQVSWTPASDKSILSHSFQHGEVHGNMVANWSKVRTERTNFSVTYFKNITQLKPNTTYAVRIKEMMIDPYKQIFHPADLKFKFRTEAFSPAQPKPPFVQKLTSTSGFEVMWDPPIDNGKPILYYILQYCDQESCWDVYNGSSTRWLVDSSVVPSQKDLIFRVAAANILGYSPFSANSSTFNYLESQAPVDNMMVLAVALSFVVVFILGAFAVIYCLIRRQQQRKMKPAQFMAVPRGPDMELATLRELPHTAIQQNNTLYAINIIPTDSDIAALPHFRRDQLMLTKFLGSGAFGEVFEGVAKNIISDSSGKTKVAVKTLRKSASDQEKEEFLKEALLMSNFRHDHILSLLGVCLDNDPQFIILELMEGGDLLSFLRSNRPSSGSTTHLNLTDLMKICVHVARGCTYLEEMHFVHRDLAARNCLVSTKNANDMVVKIGDFGLARDIYKNDYYRKEGEGLLPVRWMSPESLVDGVFTTQSDIWAFGVLNWEVLTFGQQPYQARTNIEVLHFVRAGGQLDQPENCPQEIFELMKKCWSSTPEDRPSFSHILKQLEEFHDKCAALLVDYMMPIRTQPQNSEVDGCGLNQQAKQTKLATQKISLPGHDQNKYMESEGLYRKIHRATSFDSPEPKEAHIDPTTLDYLCPKPDSMPSYLQLIHDPRDPPPPRSSKSRLSSHNSRHSSHSSRHNSHSSRHNSQSSTFRNLPNDAQGSRHSSCSSDIYSNPVGSNLRVDMPPFYQYEQIHSIDLNNAKYMPRVFGSPSIPEDEDDDAFLENYDFVDYSHPQQTKNVLYSTIRGTLQGIENENSTARSTSISSNAHCLSTSSSDDVKMSIINSSPSSVESVLSEDKPLYMEYNPATINETDKNKISNKCLNGISHSAEIMLNYDRPVIERGYNSAEARLVFNKKGSNAESNQEKPVILGGLTTDNNYVDCKIYKSLHSISSKSSSTCSVAHITQNNILNGLIPTQNWTNNNHLPSMHQDFEQEEGSLGQVYQVDNAQALDYSNDLVQASLV